MPFLRPLVYSLNKVRIPSDAENEKSLKVARNCLYVDVLTGFALAAVGGYQVYENMQNKNSNTGNGNMSGVSAANMDYP